MVTRIGHNIRSRALGTIKTNTRPFGWVKAWICLCGFVLYCRDFNSKFVLWKPATGNRQTTIKNVNRLGKFATW